MFLLSQCLWRGAQRRQSVASKRHALRLELGEWEASWHPGHSGHQLCLAITVSQGFLKFFFPNLSESVIHPWETLRGADVEPNRIINRRKFSLEVKLPTIWTDGKAEVGRVREEKRSEEKRREAKRRDETRREEKRREEERRSGKRKSQKKEGAGAPKGRRSLHCANDLWLRRVEK